MTQKKTASAQRKDRADAWDAARAVFEREPLETYSSTALRLGVSKQRVKQVADEMGWRKKADMGAILGAAHIKADAQFAAADQPGGEAVPVRPTDTAKPNDPTNRAEIAADQKAADLRADIAVRHRREWSVPRSLMQESFKDKERNHEKAKLAKTVAETLKIVQDGERKAWGMDAGDTPPGGGAAVKVIVERQEVAVER